MAASFTLVNLSGQSKIRTISGACHLYSGRRLLSFALMVNTNRNTCVLVRDAGSDAVERRRRRIWSIMAVACCIGHRMIKAIT